MSLIPRIIKMKPVLQEGELFAYNAGVNAGVKKERCFWRLRIKEEVESLFVSGCSSDQTTIILELQERLIGKKTKILR